MLLRTEDMGRTAWHLAAAFNNVDVMQKIWELAKEKLTTEEIKKKYYYLQTMRERLPGTLQHMRAI